MCMGTTIGHGRVICRSCQRVLGRCACDTCRDYVRYVVCDHCAAKPGATIR
jgi:hypothetical protein